MIRFIAAGLFIFFLPGFSLINAVFPAKGELDEDLDFLYRIVYGIGVSVALAILLGFLLGSLQYGEEGLFTARNIWVGLISLTILFFIIGWYRGAYQWLRHLHPSLVREPASIQHKDEEYEEEIKDVKELQRLKRRQMSLKKDIVELEKKGGKDLHKKKNLEEELRDTEDELKELEKKVEDRF